LLDLTYSYNVFNTGGYMVGMPVHKDQNTPGFRTLNPAAILRIEDADGNILWQYGTETNTYQRRLILEPALAYIMTDILADNEAREPAFGRGNPMELSRPAAAKTGTSNENRDSWAVGYTPQIVTGVWMGNNNNHSMNDVTGISGSAPIWHALMEYIHTRDSLSRQEWLRPSTVIERTVCQTSGLLPTRYCRGVGELFYVDPTSGIDTQPQQSDTYWKNYSVNACTWRLANASSPSNCVEDMVFFDYPPEARAWARDSGQRLPPTEYDIAGASTPFGPVAIISPQFLARVRGKIEVRGNATDENFAYYRLDYGAGTQPDVWFQLGEQQIEPGRDIVLGTWDTTPLSDGAVYTLRLTMVRADNTPETSYVSVTVDNQPPTITLLEPASGSSYQASDFYVSVQVEPDDNVQLAYVEFYRNGDLFATTEEWPHTVRWEIEESGQQTFWAIAYDAAGNSTESGHVTVTITE
jgi:membrane carboxypeptidase/penicillin-binding protein PbpC